MSEEASNKTTKISHIKRTLFIVLSLVWLFLSAWLGSQHAQNVGSHFSPPATLDPKIWRAQTSDVAENAKKRGKGAHIVDGVLSINRYGSIGPWTRFKVAEVELKISPSSQPINLLFEKGRSTLSLDLEHGRFRNPMQGGWVEAQAAVPVAA